MLNYGVKEIYINNLFNTINTGPIVPLYNKFTLMNVKKFYIFADTTYYSYPNFEMKKFLRDISLEELDYYIR